MNRRIYSRMLGLVVLIYALMWCLTYILSCKRIGLNGVCLDRSSTNLTDDTLVRSTYDTVDAENPELSYPFKNALRHGKRRPYRGYLTIGIPTMRRRPAETYLWQTLDSLLHNLGDWQKDETVIVIFLSDSDEDSKKFVATDILRMYGSSVKTGLIQVIQAPADYYRSPETLERTHNAYQSMEEVRRQSKQNYDYAFMMNYSANISEYYLHLADDVATVSDFIFKIKYFIGQVEKKYKWVCLEFSKELGFVGQFFRSKDLEKLANLFTLYYQEEPGIVTHWNFSHGRQPGRFIIQPTIFEYHEYHSMLTSKNSAANVTIDGHGDPFANAWKYGTRKPRKGYLTIGIPTMRRPANQTYLWQTLDSMLSNMKATEIDETVIVIFLSDFDVDSKQQLAAEIVQKYRVHLNTGLIQIIEAPRDFYPTLTHLKRTYNHPLKKVVWRSKQNVDYAFMMKYSANISQFYLQLEDDVTTVPDYMSKIRDFIAIQKGAWVCLEFSELGYIGKLYRSSDLEKLANLLTLFYNEQPNDVTYLHFNTLMLQPHRRIRKPTIFQHHGFHSTLSIKKSRLKDRFFDTEVNVTKIEKSVPVKKEESAPVKKEESAPKKKEESVPVKKEESATVKKEESATVTKEESAPVKKEESATVKKRRVHR